MASLTVGAINILINEASRDRLDMTDRARAFNGTYRMTITGSVKRSWNFATVPVARATANTYEGYLDGSVAVACSGDILGGSVSCFPEITGWEPVMASSGHKVILRFSLHEA